MFSFSRNGDEVLLVQEAIVSDATQESAKEAFESLKVGESFIVVSLNTLNQQLQRNTYHITLPPTPENHRLREFSVG